MKTANQDDWKEIYAPPTLRMEDGIKRKRYTCLCVCMKLHLDCKVWLYRPTTNYYHISAVSTAMLTRDIYIAILSVHPSVRRSVCHVSALCRNGLTRHPTFFSSAIAQVFPALNIFAKFRRFPPPPYEHVENRITGGYIILPFSVKSAATKGVTNISSPWKFRLRHSFPISHFCLFIIQI